MPLYTPPTTLFRNILCHRLNVLLSPEALNLLLLSGNGEESSTLVFRHNACTSYSIPTPILSSFYDRQMIPHHHLSLGLQGSAPIPTKTHPTFSSCHATQRSYRDRGAEVKFSRHCDPKFFDIALDQTGQTGDSMAISLRLNISVRWLL